MNDAEKLIKDRLQKEYGLPFTVHEKIVESEPHFVVGPSNDSEELFEIDAAFEGLMRLSMSLRMQEYSATFLKSLGHKDESGKQKFCEYAEAFKKRNAKITFRINGNEASPEDYSQWPEEWNSLELRITKSPVSQEEHFNYSDIAYDWSSLMTAMILSLAEIEPVDNEVVGEEEGSSYSVVVNKYERSATNRRLCIEHFGYRCQICGFDFEQYYGVIGKDYIQVHHIVPVSQIGPDYQIDPVKDLIPVCPNCHAMLHRKDPPFLPEELKQIINSNNNPE